MIEINDELKVYFPLKMTPRTQQVEMLEFVKKSINSGKKYILLNASVGSGKSYFAVMFTNWYKNHINKKAKFDILTNSKILQDQYVKDFPFIKNMKGRANYDCAPYNTNCSLGWEVCKTNGQQKECGDDCPYIKAKNEWSGASMGLTNFHLYNTFSIYVQTILEEKKSNVLIIDESHDFESVFCDFISTTLSAKALKKYGFDLKEVEDLDERIFRIKRIEDYIGFIENKFMKDIDNKIQWFEKASEKQSAKIRNEYSKYIAFCTSQKGKFDYLLKEYGKNKDNWVLDRTVNDKDKMYSGVVLDAKPVWGNKYMKEVIFKNYDHVIFMSGSLLDRDMFSYINGIHPKLTTYLDIESNFPLKNRPIFYMKGIGKMSYNQKHETFTKQLIWIKKILAKYPDKKGLIHSGNYEFASWLKERLKDKRLLFHDTENRDEILQKHINSKKPTVIVSPSMISGVDLKDDLARFQLIIKIPFPFLGSEKIKQRMKTNDKWYNWKTVVDILQEYGRIVRGIDDWGHTYILDDSFNDVLKYSSHIIPKYVSDAIKIINVK